MDIKLKKSRPITYIVSTGVFVIAASVALVAFLTLYLYYGLAYISEKMNDIVQPYINDAWLYFVIALLTTIVVLVISLVTVGYRDEEGRIRLNWFDKIFTDLQVVGAGLVPVALIPLSMLLCQLLVGSNWFQPLLTNLPSEAEERMNFNYTIGAQFEPAWVPVIAAILAVLVLITFEALFVQSLVKKLKGGCFWKHTIIGGLVCYLYDVAKMNESVFWKAMLILVGGCLLSATWFGIIPVLIATFIFVPKFVRKYEAIKEGVNQVKNGNLEYKIAVNAHGELDRLAMSINEISESSNRAVQNELKNQRMKTDLISNVSHDLRTPLTSMITYVDLLKTEGLGSEHAPEYLQIVDEKTRRLRKLTEDLFEAAKASSGAIPVNITKIEMTSIVNQALAELEEKLDANNLDVIFGKKTEETYVMADGQLLWRVIENLLVNTSKYSLPGSRVYVDITEKGTDMILLEIKNMSKDPLNISADELTERFKRGDEARNTEGSGLGLAIAKDLTKLMNGWFDIVVDGDLFKTSVALFKSEVEQSV